MPTRVLSLGWLLRGFLLLFFLVGILVRFLVAFIVGMNSTLRPTLMKARPISMVGVLNGSRLQAGEYVRYDVHRPSVAECLVAIGDGDALRVAFRKRLQTFRLSDG